MMTTTTTSTTTSPDDFWLALQSTLINTTHNWNQKRPYNGSMMSRKEGFTEHWGSGLDEQQSDSPSSAAVWDRVEGKSAVQDMLATHYPHERIMLFQYRPAWEEQFALRIADVPHVVVNSGYAVNETTGPLPQLRDLQPDKPPVLVGRNSILEYLKGKFDLNQGLSSSLANTAELFVHLIQEMLEPYITALHYNDWNAYAQVYRKQGITASSGGSAGWGRLFSSWWQVYGERIHTQMTTMTTQQRQMTKEQALGEVRKAYQLLETQLQENTYLMGTERPVLVDVLLFGSLTKALTDIHLIIVLADFPGLCKYIHRIWDTYFNPPSRPGVPSSSEIDWRQWNAQENARNAFFTLPLIGAPSSDQGSASTSSNNAHEFHHAVELMEKLSLQSHDLHEQLVLAKEARIAQDQHLRLHRPFLTWYRWRMGGELRGSSDEERKRRQQQNSRNATPTSEQQAKLKREYQRNDVVWLMTAAVTTVSSLVLFGLAGGSQEQ